MRDSVIWDGSLSQAKGGAKSHRPGSRKAENNQMMSLLDANKQVLQDKGKNKRF